MRKRNRHPRAFTLAELLIATAILGAIALAAAAFMSAAAAAWKGGDDAFRLANLSARSGDRVENVIAKMLYVLQAQPSTSGGTASYLFFWESDAISGSADGQAALGEMALLEFDPTTNAVWLWEPIATSKMTSAQLANAQNTNWGDPTASSIITYYKGLDFIAPRQVVIGGQTGASLVTACSFGFTATSGNRPIVTYSLTLKQGTLTTSAQGSVALRLGQQPTNLN